MILPAPLATCSPVMVAPMAGGPSTPQLVAAAVRGGWFAQLAAGYLSVEVLGAQLDEVRRLGAETFGVNLFVPNLHTVDRSAYDTYRAVARPEFEAVGVDPETTSATPVEDDDAWASKVELLLAQRVPAVSFTFGLPDPEVIAAFVAAGTVTMQTVTSVEEATLAARAGVDALIVQGSAAGGHSGVWQQDALPADVPLVDLVREVRDATTLPIVATGGIVRRTQVHDAIAAGADAIAVGTAVLRADEAGTSATYAAALADPAFNRTTLTRAFTGRPARALVNRFVEAHTDAPSGYPALHHLTRPMRVAAAQQGDASRLHLWAGEGWRETRAAPLATILAELTP